MVKKGLEWVKKRDELMRKEVKVNFFVEYSVRSDDVVEYVFADVSIHGAQRVV